jgi:hypothetical protein
MTDNNLVEAPNEAAPVQAPSATPMMLLEKAMTDPNFNPDSMQKLMDMQERWENREAEKAFNAAFAKMQGELPVIVREAEGHNCKYETLESLLKSVRPILINNGFAMSWATEPDPDDKGRDVVMKCTLAHIGGHYISSSGSLAPDDSGSKNPAQAAGSSRTYLQRYLAKGLLGITVANDDDGNASSGTITPEQVEYINAELDRLDGDKAKFCARLKVNAIPDILLADYGKADKALKEKAAQVARVAETAPERNGDE